MRILCYGAVDCTHLGGVQRVVTGLGGALRDAGDEVLTVWSAPADRAVDGHAICPLHARTTRLPPFLPRRRSHLPSLARAARLLARFRPEVVNVHFATRAAYSFLVLKRAFGYRLVLSLHGSDVFRPSPQDRAYLPVLLNGADGITAVSRAVQSRALGHSGARAEKVRIIPNGIDTHFWQPAAGRPDPGEGPLIVAVGRLEPVKGFDVLLTALHRLHQRGVAARLMLIGAGSQEGELRRQAAQLGLERWTEFTGPLAPGAVRERLHAAQAFVLSSRDEGQGLSLMEAMACAVPCVATRVGGVVDYADGIVPLVPPGEPEALAEALRLVLADPVHAAELGALAARKIRDCAIGITNRAYRNYFQEIAIC